MVNEFMLNGMEVWYPLICNVVRTPKTVIVTVDPEDRADVCGDLLRIVNGEDPVNQGKVQSLVDRVIKAGNVIGYPAFLRSGEFSGKHEWSKCCYMPEGADVLLHMLNIVSLGEMVNFIGFPYHTWVVREFLKGDVVEELPKFGGMPVVPEVRVFANSNESTHIQHYWPDGALRQGGSPDPAGTFNRLRDAWGDSDIEAAKANAVLCARACNEGLGLPPDHGWSVDTMLTTTGLYVTDMATEATSYKYDDAPEPVPDVGPTGLPPRQCQCKECNCPIVVLGDEGEICYPCSRGVHEAVAK